MLTHRTMQRSLVLLLLLATSTQALIDPSIVKTFARNPKSFTLPLTHATGHPYVVDVLHVPTVSSTITPLDDDSLPSLLPANHSFHPTQYVDSTISLSGCSNVDFSAPVYINNQGPFRLIVDTGSTTMAVISAACSCNGVTPTFDTTGLTTTLDEGKVGVSYADGSSWSGAGWTGSVSLGVSSTGGSGAVSMVFGTIDEQTNFVKNSQCGVSQSAQNWHQGIIGFAYPALASPGTDEWFANYQAATGIRNEFTMQMCATANETTSGNLWLGSYDVNYLGGQFTYIPIVKQQHYGVYLNKITVVPSSSSEPTAASTALPYDSTTLGPCDDGTGSTFCAIIDSGTTYLALPAVVKASLIAAIRQDAMYQQYIASVYDVLGQTNCWSTNAFASKNVLNAMLPKIAFSFGTDSSGGGLSVIYLQAIEGYLVTSYDASTPANSFYCNGIGSTGTAAAILGYSFMSQFTVRHDITNSRIGFALTANCGQQAPILLDLQWETNPWSACSATCGGGFQWRYVNCTDVYGLGHTDIECINGLAGPKPAIAQACNTGLCSVSSTTSVTSVSASLASSTVMQGATVSVHFSFQGMPNSISLYLIPVQSLNTQPFYLTKNASFSASSTSGTFAWTVPSLLPAGQYIFGGFASSSVTEFVAPSSAAFTVTSCASPPCGLPACGMDGAYGSATCSQHGACDQSSGSAVCTCVAGYTGSKCETAPTFLPPSACAIQCLNNGIADYDNCTCVCPNNFSGVLCEYRFTTLSAVMTVNSHSIDQTASAMNNALFQLAFAQDIAFAAGVPSNDVQVTSIFPAGATGSKAAVLFTLATPTSSATLSTYVDSLLTTLSVSANASTAQSSCTVLSMGLQSRWITSLVVVDSPPGDVAPSTSTGDDLIVTLTNHLTLAIGIACGIFGGLIVLCFCCICCMRREAMKTLSHAAHRRKTEVTKREKLLYGEAKNDVV